MKTIKSAIVGCGSIAQVHGQVLSQLEGAQLVAFADCIPERAQEMARHYGGNAYASLEELLDRETPDVLHLCTPHVLHTPMARQAVDRGIHVFTEKPPVIHWEQWGKFSTLEDPGQPGHPRVGVCFQNRYNQSVRCVKSLLENAGKILGARAFVTWSRNAAYYTESGWRGKLDTEGGGVLINQSIHTLDLLVQFLGKPVRVEASLSNRHLKEIIEVEDTLEAYVEFTGATALFYATTAYSTDAPVLVELHCEKGKIRMEENEVSCQWTDGSTQRFTFETPKVNGKAYWGSSHVACIADFYSCIRSGRRFLNDIPGVRSTVELMLSVYDSARERRVVTL